MSVLDNFSSGRKVNLDSAMKSGFVEVIEGDIKNFDFGAYFQEHPTDVVFHLAAQIDVRRSV